MKFMVVRTSEREAQPCDGATKEHCIVVDERTVDDPSKLNEYEPLKSWMARGRNHRVENGHIKRDFDDEAWFLEINSLDELLLFVEKHGKIVVGPAWQNDDIMRIEIYDDYRE